MIDAGISPWAVLKQASRAVPAVKWALGIGGILAVVALVPAFHLNATFAFLGVVVTLILMGVLVLFARASSLPQNTTAGPALVFTWFVLVIFMATSVCLFSSVFFNMPISLQNWLTRQQVVAKPPPQQTLPEIPNADSGWVDGGSSPSKFCEPILASLRAKYPEFHISMTTLPEQHRSEYAPFKHDLYRYQCSFRATAR